MESTKEPSEKPKGLLSPEDQDIFDSLQKTSLLEAIDELIS